MGLQVITTDVGFGIHHAAAVSDRHFVGWDGAATFLRSIAGSGADRGFAQAFLFSVTAEDAKRRWLEIPLDLKLRWYELQELSLDHAWPEWSIRFRSARTVDTRHYKPGSGRRALGFDASGGQKARFEQLAESFLQAVRKYSRAKVGEGWHAHPAVAWERVDEMPTTMVAGAGAFRTAATGPKIIAQRGPSGPLETVWSWLASSPERRWRDTPKELVVTQDSLFARFWSGEAYRLPLAALRERRAPEESDDAVYVFGRSTHVVLLAGEGCPVDAALRRVLDRNR